LGPGLTKAGPGLTKAGPAASADRGPKRPLCRRADGSFRAARGAALRTEPLRA
jgi:hypothetical protein